MLNIVIRNSCRVMCAGALALMSGAAIGQEVGTGVETGVAAEFGGEFTYQGSLEFAGSPADGVFDFRFSVFSDSGIQIHAPITIPGVGVDSGIFSVVLDFDEILWTTYAPFEKYLQIEVRIAGSGSYTPLSPRQQLTATPHASVASISRRISFPYIETLTGMGANDRALDLKVNGGTAIRLETEDSDSPVFILRGTNPLNSIAFFDHLMLLDDQSSYTGMIAIGDRYSTVGYSSSPNALAAVLGQVGTAAGVGAAGFRGIHPSGNDVSLSTSAYAGRFSGEVYVPSGEITADYGSTKSPATPIAYGFINGSGTPGNATGNILSTWNAAQSRYEITLSDRAISFGNTTVIATVVDSAEPRVVTTNISGSLLLVKVWDINSGNIAVQDNFQIVMYEANPVPIARDAIPAGMDPEYYYMQTGTTPPRGAPIPAEPAAEVQGVVRD